MKFQGLLYPWRYTQILRVITLTVAFMVCSIFASGDVTHFNLGGMRRVDALVKHDQKGYQCELSFVAVTCFSPATNRKINLSKSREYAIRALAKAVGVTNGTVRVVKLFVSQPLAVDGPTATIKYKAENVEIAAVSAPSKSITAPQTAPQTKPDASSDHLATDDSKEKSLLNCLEDMRSTMRALDVSLTEEITNLKLSRNLDDAVADLEQKGVDDYERLKAETQTEKLLLSTEKTDLLAEINQKHRNFIDHLSAAYTELEPNKNRKSKP